jgi:hypothetical protein
LYVIGKEDRIDLDVEPILRTSETKRAG